MLNELLLAFSAFSLTLLALCFGVWLAITFPLAKLVGYFVSVLASLGLIGIVYFTTQAIIYEKTYAQGIIKTCSAKRVADKT